MTTLRLRDTAQEHLLHCVPRSREGWPAEQAEATCRRSKHEKTMQSQRGAPLVPGDIPVPGSRPWWGSTMHPSPHSPSESLLYPQSKFLFIYTGMYSFLFFIMTRHPHRERKVHWEEKSKASFLLGLGEKFVTLAPNGVHH